MGTKEVKEGVDEAVSDARDWALTNASRDLIQMCQGKKAVPDALKSVSFADLNRVATWLADRTFEPEPKKVWKCSMCGEIVQVGHKHGGFGYDWEPNLEEVSL